MKRTTTTGRIALAAVILGSLAVSASANFEGALIHVQATNSFGTGGFDVNLNQFAYNAGNDSYSWNSTGPISIQNSQGTEIASIRSLDGYFQNDPVIGLGFFVQSGAVATHFTISSAQLSFGAINPAEGQATSGTSVTDFDGDGATFTGNNGGNAYSAYFNGLNANLFSSQIGSYNVGSGLTDIRNGTFGFTNMGSVVDMNSVWDFNLSANDLASGTSRYEVRAVPEPVSMIALALGALALRRRKK